MNFRKIVEYTSDAKERRALNPTGVYYVEFKAMDEICGVSADGRKVAEITHEKTFNWLMDRQRAGLFVVAVDLEMRVQAPPSRSRPPKMPSSSISSPWASSGTRKFS